MKKLLLILLSMTLFSYPALAKKKADSISLNGNIQEVQAATLDDEDNDKPKKKKSSKKSKKSKKAKKG